MVLDKASQGAPTREGITALIVDDEEFNRDILIEFLEEAGYRVIGAANGQQALDQLAAHPETDLIILDRMMPDLDGLEVLKRIKADPQRRDLPVIMQTAAAASQQILEGIRAGAFYYLTKPYQKELLLTIVATACTDLTRMREIQQIVVGQGRILALMDQARFRFRTLEEAKGLAHLVAECCPAPERAVYGLSELMINAVEHGNLGITYAEKSALVRSGAWQQEVVRRLDLPENRGRFAILEFEARVDDLLIVIRDQGAGFDWCDYLEISPRRAGDPNGRGVAMARAISFTSLAYSGSGNRVTCTIARDTAKAT